MRTWQQVSDRVALEEQVRHGQAAGWTSGRIAAALKAAGHHTPRGQPFTAASVRQMRKRLGPPAATAPRGREHP